MSYINYCFFHKYQFPQPMMNPRPLNPHAPSYIPIIIPPPPVLAPPPPPPLPPPFFVDSHPSRPSSTTLFPQPPPHSLIYRVPLYTQPFSSSPYEIQTQNPSITTSTYLPPSPPPQLRATTGQSGGSTHRRYFEDSTRGRGPQKNQPPARFSGRGFQRGGGSRWRGRGGCRRDQKFEKPVLHLKRDEETTTVMIKNIPYDYTRELLLWKLDKFCRQENRKVFENRTDEKESNESIIAAYDFLYYPIDFKSKRGRGFAFVNLTHPTTVWKLVNAFHHKKWDYVNGDIWPKVIEIVSAKFQGKEALEKHFAGSSFECETDEFLPVSFTPPRDGSDDPSVKLTTIGTIGKRRGALYRESKYNHEG